MKPTKAVDGAGRVADDDAEAEPEEPEESQEGPGKHEAAQHARLAQGGRRRMARQNGLAEEEAGEGQNLAHHERDGAHHDHLAGQEQRAPRGGGQRGADGPAAVLAGDGQDAEDADGQRAEGQPGQGLVGRIEARRTPRPVVLDVVGGQEGDAAGSPPR